MLPYVLPGLPAAAILAGGWLARQRRQGFQTDRWLASGLLITLMVMCGLALQNLSQPDKMEYKSVKAMLAVYDTIMPEPSGCVCPRPIRQARS